MEGGGIFKMKFKTRLSIFLPRAEHRRWGRSNQKCADCLSKASSRALRSERRRAGYAGQKRVLLVRYLDGLVKSPILPRRINISVTLHSSRFASRISNFFRNRRPRGFLRGHLFFSAEENEQNKFILLLLMGLKIASRQYGSF